MVRGRLSEKIVANENKFAKPLETAYQSTSLEDQTHNLLSSLSLSDWQAQSARVATKSTGEPATGQVSFDSDIYSSNLNKAVSSITSDEKAFKGDTKGSAAQTKDLATLNTDETNLHNDVMSLKNAAPTFTDFSNVMNPVHTTLKADATGLWQMGLKTQASDTTAYFPLSQYAKDFSDKGGGGGGGTGGGSGTDYNLDNNAKQPVNTIASQIGGTGDITSTSLTQTAPDTLKYSATGGSYGDALWRSDMQTPQANAAKNIDLSENFTLSSTELKNDHEIEKDIVVQKKDGSFGTVGTQINPQTGEVDYWNTVTSHWVNEGSLGPLQANKDYNLKIDATVNDTGNPSTGSYTYTNYSLNGDKLNSTENTFATKKLASPWTPGVYIQTQLDLGSVPKGTSQTASLTESGEVVNVS